MTHWTEAADLLEDSDRPRPGAIARYAPGLVAFLLSASLGAYLVYLRPMSDAASPPKVAEAAPALKTQSDPFGGLVPVVPAPGLTLSLNPFGGLVTKGFGSSARFALAEAPTPPIRPGDHALPSDGAPLPPRRPSELARSAEPHAPSRIARLEPTIPAPVETPAAPAGPGIFEKLFGGSTTRVAKEPEQRLAYAAPPSTAGVSAALAARNGGLGSPGGAGGFLRGLTFGSGTNPTSRFGDRVAVYDISAKVVYMPDGTRLEAHSGLGESRDDPNRVNERMRGPTPPATYALTPRETSFHGVDALRLTPIDSKVFGRAGLLAHTFMLGAEGDSNGCVSFRDYDAFLRAYRSGQINKLVVVTRL